LERLEAVREDPSRVRRARRETGNIRLENWDEQAIRKKYGPDVTREIEALQAHGPQGSLENKVSIPEPLYREPGN